MPDPEQLARENEVLRERIRALSDATLRIGATLDVTTVLEDISHSARTLVGAQFAVIVMVNDAGQPLDVVMSGFDEEHEQRLRTWEEGVAIFKDLVSQPGPRRFSNMRAHTHSLGLPDDLIASNALQSVPMRHQGALVGCLILAEKEGGSAFTDEDEEVLVLLAAQAAAAVAHARAHRAERRAHADLEAVVETAPVGVVVFDAVTGRHLSTNREAKRIVQSLHPADDPPESLLGKMTVHREDGRETALSQFPFAELLRTAETVRREEIVLSVSDGRSVSVLLDATPIYNEDGATTSVVVTMQDLAPLQEIERQRAEFIGLVGHELRAPLSAVKGAAATVLGTPTDLDAVETREFFRIVDQQADHMRTLIADLLDAGRLETGTLSVTPESTEVAVLDERARTTCLAGRGDRVLQVDLPSNLPLVMADRQRIVQVLNNLFANADRHSPSPSPIRVEATRDGAYVAISVVDAGTGVAQDQLPHLFRKDSAVRTGGRRLGTGLGLAICKGLVEAHGGRIRAESAGLGEGLRITFTIPTGEVAAANAPALVDAMPDTDHGSKSRILVVDDDPRTLRFARNALDGPDYATFVTGDASEVGPLIREHRPHLVLLDLLLPDVDGVELMADVPELGDLPVIFISAYGRDETIARALEAGAADYIVKPFSPTELIARIRAALRQHQAPEPFRIGELAIDYDARRVTLGGEPLVLTATEYELLRVLSANAGRVTTYEALKRRVWEGRSHAEPALVRTFVKKLRRKLGDDPAGPAYIQNERGVGYRMPRPD